MKEKLGSTEVETMPGPEDRKEEKQQDQNSQAHPSFEELEKQAREADYALTEQRNQLHAQVRADFEKKYRDYENALNGIESANHTTIHKIRTAKRIAEEWSLTRKGLSSFVAFKNTSQHDYNKAVELKNSTASEDEKLLAYVAYKFPLVREDEPEANEMTPDELIRLSEIRLPDAPKVHSGTGALENAYRDREILEMRDEITQTFRELLKPYIRWKELREREEERAEENGLPLKEDTPYDVYMQKFRALFLTLNTLDKGHEILYDPDTDIITPQKAEDGDPSVPMSPLDEMEESYCAYLASVHPVSGTEEQEASALTPEEQKTLSGIQKLHSMFVLYWDTIDGYYNGELSVPPETEEFEDGKKIHRINAVGVKPEQTKKIIEAYGRERISYTPCFRKNRALFPEGPDAADIGQGSVGDCYFLAALSAAAAQDPSKIREAMRQNPDGTVTVRFYTETREPVYVTVDTEIPTVNTGYYDKRPIYAEKSLWAAVMEKAYVQSGLHKGRLSAAEAASDARKEVREAEKALADAGDSPEKRAAAEEMKRKADAKAEANAFVPNYGDIASGLPIDAAANLLGTDMHTEADKESVPDAGKTKDGYTPKELAFAEKLKEAMENGTIVTADIYDSDMKSDDRHKTVDGHTLDEAGINSHHAYSVTEFEKKEGKYYLTLRNPHGKTGAESGKDGLIHRLSGKEADGYLRLELRDFEQYFDEVYYNRYALTPARRETMAEAGTIVRQYGGAVRKIAETLRDSDSIGLYFKNSDKFKAFRDSAAKLDLLMNTKAPSPKQLNEGLEDFFRTAEAYGAYCKNEKKVSANPTAHSRRALLRYQSAEIAGMLRTVYENNKGKTLKDAWQEFSYSEAVKKTEIPTTAAEMRAYCAKRADGMANVLTGNLGTFRDAGNRNKVYTYLRDFMKSEEHRKISPKDLQNGSEGKRFEAIRKNAMTVTTVFLLGGHADRLAKQMAKDGQRALAEELLSRKPVYTQMAAELKKPAPASAAPAAGKAAAAPQRQ